MIVVKTRSDGGLEITPSLTSPCIYVDYAGIADLATDQDLGPRFRDALMQAGGTLYISWAHLLELFGLGIGPLHTRIRQYLDGFGPNFVMIDCNAQNVIARERAYQAGMQNPAIDVRFMKVMVSNWDATRPLSPASLLDFITESPQLAQDFKRMHQRHRDGLHEILKQARKTYSEDRDVQRRIRNAQHHHVVEPPQQST